MKRVLLIVIDALSSWVVQPAMENGELPHLQALTEAGQVRWNCTSVFPSITPAATAAIGTGRYPSEHRVLGAHFYDRQSDKVHYFGGDMWVILNKRLGNFFDDFLWDMNHRCLSAETIYERLERHGRSCAALNFLIFRGQRPHKVRTPWILRCIPGVRSSAEVYGPEILCLGDFVSHRSDRMFPDLQLRGRGGLFARYGFTDRVTQKYLTQLAQQGLPDFTLAYFPDNDFDSHALGPKEALKTVKGIDDYLGKLCAVYGGIERMLSEVVVIITGDHSQSETLAEPDVNIDLAELLGEYQVVPAGSSWNDADELMICPNLRVAQMYLRSGYYDEREAIVDCLLEEERIDQVIWRVPADQGPRHDQFAVATKDRGRLVFWRAQSAEDADAIDALGNTWQFRGELTAVDGQVGASGHLTYRDYPHALERVACAFDNRVAGDLWVTARPGYEFSVPKTEVHPLGGSHGTLHRLDSTSPLIMAGSERDLPAEQCVRTIDIAPLCASLLGVPDMRSEQERRLHLEYRLT